VPEQPKSKKGPKPKKGPRLPTPAKIAKQAVPVGQEGAYQWREVKVSVYGVQRVLLACEFRHFSLRLHHSGGRISSKRLLG